jgi:hypothetical protein
MDGENTIIHDARAPAHFYDGALRFSLELFGDRLSEREGFKHHKGTDAVRYFLMLKFGWLPREVRSLSFDDLWFAMGEEFHGWSISPEAQQSYRSNEG